MFQFPHKTELFQVLSIVVEPLLYEGVSHFPLVRLPGFCFSLFSGFYLSSLLFCFTNVHLHPILCPFRPQTTNQPPRTVITSVSKSLQIDGLK